MDAAAAPQRAGGPRASGAGMGRKRREVIFEFHRVGNAVKVSAVDPETLVEVSILGRPDSGEEMLKRVALKKLDYVLARRRGGGEPR